MADIHARLYKRHAEYQAVFNKFFNWIDANKKEGDVIFLGGDIVHSKTDMSPELIQIVSKFFKDCADRLPTILILGNHDLNLQNPNRLDALTPIVDSLNHGNLYYWKDTGVYKYGGIQFSVMSVLGKPQDWIWTDQMEDGYKIALHHGALNTARTDLNYRISNDLVTPEKFSKFDLTLLGDIHQFQYLNEEKTIAYPSSTIQQNFGESLHNHGFIVWNLEDKSSEFIELENDYGYYTFEFRDSVWINPEKNLPKIIRSRVKYENTPKETVIEFFKRLGKNHQISEIIYQKKDANATKTYDTNVLVKDMRDVENQNQLIVDFLKESLDIRNEEILDSIRHLNREINSEFKSSQTGLRAVTWKLKKFWFANMFSYGDESFIDFESLDGIVGLFAPNAHGKSAALSALCFCLFDKCPVGSKGIHILNTRKNDFKCRVEFEISGNSYVIERIGTKNEKSGNVKVDVSFVQLDSDGNETVLNGEDRDGTNKIIRDYIGTYEDFLMTTLSSQVDNQSFIDKSQRERKELLYKFLDISVFENLWKLGKDRLREVQFHIKELDEVQLRNALVDSEEKMNQYKIYLQQLQDSINEGKNSATGLLDQINELSKEINTTVVDYDIVKIERDISRKDAEIQEISIMFRDSSYKLRIIEESLTKCIFSESEFGKLAKKIAKFEKLTKELQRLQIELHKLDSSISDKQQKIKHLDSHEYNPDCEFCIKNPFVSDARSAQDSIQLDKQERESVLYKVEYAKSEIKKLNGIKKEYEEAQGKRQEGINLTYQSELTRQKQESLLYRAQTLKNELLVLESEKAKYYEQEIIIKKNAELNSEIIKLKAELAEWQSKETQLQKQYRNVFATLATEKEKRAANISGLEKLQKYIGIQTSHEYYIKAVSKEGVPYKILSVILPLIEYEVNETLSQLVDFTIRFEASDDKNIFAYIVYSEDKFWPVEMTSGMERFVLSQAIRTALTNISNLPKSNFIAIDEGFGVLDSDNLNSIYLLFEHLKERVDFILCVSHIDSMRDIVDNVIQVDKIDGFSRISMEN